MSDEQIEKFYEKVRELDDDLNRSCYWIEGVVRNKLRLMFPEAFNPKRHPAIEELDWILEHPEIRVGDYTKMIERIRSAFNDDGSLKP